MNNSLPNDMSAIYSLTQLLNGQNIPRLENISNGQNINQTSTPFFNTSQTNTHSQHTIPANRTFSNHFAAQPSLTAPMLHQPTNNSHIDTANLFTSEKLSALIDSLLQNRAADNVHAVDSNDAYSPLHPEITSARAPHLHQRKLDNKQISNLKKQSFHRHGNHHRYQPYRSHARSKPQHQQNYRRTSYRTQPHQTTRPKKEPSRNSTKYKLLQIFDDNKAFSVFDKKFFRQESMYFTFDAYRQDKGFPKGFSNAILSGGKIEKVPFQRYKIMKCHPNKEQDTCIICHCEAVSWQTYAKDEGKETIFHSATGRSRYLEKYMDALAANGYGFLTSDKSIAFEPSNPLLLDLHVTDGTNRAATMLFVQPNALFHNLLVDIFSIDFKSADRTLLGTSRLDKHQAFDFLKPFDLLVNGKKMQLAGNPANMQTVQKNLKSTIMDGDSKYENEFIVRSITLSTKKDHKITFTDYKVNIYTVSWKRGRQKIHDLYGQNFTEWHHIDHQTDFAHRKKINSIDSNLQSILDCLL